MRPRSTFQLAVLGVAVGGLQIFGVACNESVIEDPNLNKAIREQTGQWAAPLMPADLAGLTELHLTSKSIHSLAGLQHAVNLRELTLTTKLSVPNCGVQSEIEPNEVSDLSPLVELVHLESLKIEGNPVADLVPLQGLTGLETLALDRCQVHSLESLKGLTNLRYVGLSQNHITDLSPLIANHGLALGDAIDVSGNPLGAGADKAIAELKARGVALTSGGEAPESPAV